ncbi:MAG: PQQ-dependent sugar dehydrogenase [Armatimonadetes bacterium]|nr:PQQ-dependent sugar dehydrogenase [Armatimonadota bacterium]
MLARVRWVFAALFFAVLLACGGSSTSAPVPAIHGQLVASGFNQPMLYLVNPASPTLAYVIERPGHVRLLTNDVLQTADVLDISGTVVTDGECGLLGMAFDPNFSSNHYVYLHYNAGSPIETRIVRYTMSGDGLTMSNPFPIFSFQQPVTANHKGGSINFGSDGMLYLMTGDGGSGNDPNNYAQTPTSFLGKILRIDVTSDDFAGDPEQNYHVPTDNPWFNTAGVNPEIWAFGLRNPFRWTFDATSNGFLIADVGQDAYEEVDYVPISGGGRNFGWSLREGLHGTGNPGPAFSTPFSDPFFEYSHGFGESIIGGFVYHGTALDASLQGRYFFGDYITSKIVSIPFARSGGEAVSTSLGASMDHTGDINSSLNGTDISGPVSFNPDRNGEIMVVNLNNGTLVRLVP